MPLDAVILGAGFGGDRVADFLSGLSPTSTYTEASVEPVASKKVFGSSRRERWFG